MISPSIRTKVLATYSDKGDVYNLFTASTMIQPILSSHSLNIKVYSLIQLFNMRFINFLGFAAMALAAPLAQAPPSTVVAAPSVDFGAIFNALGGPAGL